MRSQVVVSFRDARKNKLWDTGLDGTGNVRLRTGRSDGSQADTKAAFKTRPTHGAANGPSHLTTESNIDIVRFLSWAHAYFDRAVACWSRGCVSW